MSDLPSGLLPEDDDGDLAAASALDDPFTLAEPDVPLPEPFGTTWAFDWENGRFFRSGGAPTVVRGMDALAEWLEMARRTARGAHPAVFSDEFGMDNPDDWQGDVAIVEKTADYGKRLEDAWLVHDRIVAVSDYEATWLPGDQAIDIDVTVETDQEDVSTTVSGSGPFFIGGD